MAKETIKCEICSCELPSQESLEVHRAGKRHKKLQAVWENMRTLSERSIFISGLYSGFDEDQIRVQMERHFGTVERVIPSKQKSTSGVVEFASKEAAQKALVEKRVVIGAETGMISKRLMSMDKVEDVNKKLIEMDRLIESIRESSDYHRQIESLIQHYGISEDEIRIRREAMAKLVACLKEYFSDDIDIVLFGSSITGLGLKSSDADAALVFKEGPLNALEHQADSLGRDKMTLLTCNIAMFQSRKIQRGEFARLSSCDRVRLMAKILNDVRKRYGYFQNQKPIVDARCPLVRFTFENRIPFDISVDNQLSVAKSEWLKMVVERSHPRIRPFLFGLRIWAQSNGLFDAHGLPKGFFNSYMINCLAINYLQMKHLIAPHQVVGSDEGPEWNLEFDRTTLKVKLIHLPALFREFFVFCIQTDHKSFVHVVRNNAMVPVEEFKATMTDKRVLEGFKFGVINVQDPIELSHNITTNVVHDYLALMRQKMMLSLAKMKQTPKGVQYNFADILAIDYGGVNMTELSNKSNESELMIHLEDRKGDVYGALDNIFQNILLCTTVASNAKTPGTPPAKRRCLGDEYGAYERKFEAIVPVWIGRRNVRNKLRDQYRRQFLPLEFAVSQKIAETAKVDKPLVFSVTAMVSAESVVSVSIVKVKGGDQDYHNFTHFLHLSEFLQQCINNLLEPSVV